MPEDRSTLLTTEIDAALTATSSSRLLNGKNKVNHLGNVDTPTLNIMRGVGKANATPVRGAYKAHLAGKRGGKLQGVSGRDIHIFESRDTLFDIEFSVGRVHLGDEWVHQQIEDAGLPIDYTEVYQTKVDISKPGWWSKGAESLEVLVNLAEVKLEALELNFVQELNKAFWRANASDPKFWPGVDSALSWSSNSVGPIGNRQRTNPDLRHKLYPSINGADIELTFDKMRRAANKRCRDGTRVDMWTVGEDVIDAIKERMFTGSNAVGTIRLTRDYDQARGEAQARAQKLSIGLPDDAFYLTGVGMIMPEPVFEDLQLEDAAAISWQKRIAGFNSSHIRFIPTKSKDGAKRIHATPYNQLVTRISCYGEYALVLDRVDCHVMGYLA